MILNDKILFKLATRSRPQKAKNSIENIINLCQSDNYVILLSIDEDDVTMNDFDYSDDRVIICRGLSKNKIDAINRDIFRINDWQILINTSDDMKFEIKGFDTIIRQDFNKDFDKVIHYSDGKQHSNIMTMSIMGIDYYKRFNYIYHPDYQSLWSDVEATEVAWLLGKYQYQGDNKILFRHYHPSWGLSEYDEQYRKTESAELRNSDYAVFKYRKNNNYFLPNHLIINNPKYNNV